jgi:hypothetical protein
VIIYSDLPRSIDCVHLLVCRQSSLLLLTTVLSPSYYHPLSFLLPSSLLLLTCYQSQNASFPIQCVFFFSTAPSVLITRPHSDTTRPHSDMTRRHSDMTRLHSDITRPQRICTWTRHCQLSPLHPTQSRIPSHRYQTRVQSCILNPHLHEPSPTRLKRYVFLVFLHFSLSYKVSLRLWGLRKPWPKTMASGSRWWQLWTALLWR